MNEEPTPTASRSQQNAHALGNHTPVGGVLELMAQQYAFFAQCAALVDALAFQRGVHCDCPGLHVSNCPVAEAIELVRKMAAM